MSRWSAGAGGDGRVFEDFQEDGERRKAAVVAETLRSSSGISMMEATDLRQGDDVAEVGWLYRPWLGRVFRQ
jgi:hypothetical protein